MQCDNSVQEGALRCASHNHSIQQIPAKDSPCTSDMLNQGSSIVLWQALQPQSAHISRFGQKSKHGVHIMDPL
jgi:hypothetical protein